MIITTITFVNLFWRGLLQDFYDVILSVKEDSLTMIDFKRQISSWIAGHTVQPTMGNEYRLQGCTSFKITGRCISGRLPQDTR